jgi:serine phosphatase RsbU (regulator of sigma subunit)/CHASE1-domain containing sensor protein
MRRNRALRGLIVLAIVVGAILVALEVWNAEKRSVERENDALARRAAAAVVRAVDFTAGSLRGAQGLLEYDGTMGRNRFKRFAREVLASGTIETMVWAPRVAGPQRRDFVRNRLNGRSIVGIDEEGPGTVPIGRKAVYYPVELIQPENDAAATFIGVDLISDPARSRAALEARDSGEATATAPIATVRTGELGVTVFQPLYRPNMEHDTPIQRRRSIRGFVTGTFYMRVLAQQVTDALPDGADFSVADGEDVLYDSGLEDNEYTKQAVADVVGRTWTVRAAGSGGPSLAAALGIGVGGGIVALLAALVFVLADRREARLEARRRGAELRSRRDALQARTADVLESGLTVRERMSALANELVPSIADFCIVDVEERAHGGWRRAGAAAADPELRERLASGRRVGGIPLGPNPGRAALLFDSDARAALVAGDETEGLDEVPVSSLIVLRLFSRGRRVGLMLLGRIRRQGVRDFTADDMQQLRELGNRAALALDSARLYERERGTAEILQSRLLPARLPRPRGIEAAAVYRAGGEGLYVGGDFYDLYPVPEGWVAVVGDVCGSGAEAASLTSLLRHTLRTGSRLSRPEHALALVDAAAREETEGRTFLTLAAAWLDDPPPGSSLHARVAVGGHPEPRLVKRDGTVDRIPPNGPLLGVVNEWSISTTEVTIEQGETLFLFTDGLTEARRNGELYGDERLDLRLAGLAHLPLEEMLSALEEDVVSFADDGVGDDLAMLALRPRSGPPPLPKD